MNETNSILVQLVTLFSHLLELYGALVIIYGSTWYFARFVRTNKDGRYIRLNLASYLAFGLEFKMGGEILRTVIVRSLDEIYFLGAIIILRALLNLIIHWEIKQEKMEDDHHR